VYGLIHLDRKRKLHNKDRHEHHCQDLYLKVKSPCMAATSAAEQGCRYSVKYNKLPWLTDVRH
jgi:hypothetical protein